VASPNLNSSSTPPYQLLSASGSGYRTGQNLTSMCTGALTILCTDLNGNSRPTTGAWDKGAFYFTSGGGTVATPTFLPVTGTYVGTVPGGVTISDATAGAVICFTTDGSTPTEVANACSGGTTQTYSTPITISSTKTVNAFGTLSGSTDSAVGSAVYAVSPYPIAPANPAVSMQ
jgi:Chitobiase/beta-hexosaminidase C-terminal domain